MSKNDNKTKYKNIISINDIRKRKGLPPVECAVDDISKEDEEEKILEQKIEELDSKYDSYIVATKDLKDDKKKMKAFKDFLDYYNTFFDFIYEKEAKRMLRLSPLKDEINYAMTGSGKRLRPFLMYLTYRAFGGDVTDELINFMIAIELIHSFSLIHDDMPCMDNDELRRGKPSVWKKFGEAKALLAGDAMISMAYEIAGYSLLDCTMHQSEYIDTISEDFDENGEVYFEEEDVADLWFNAHEAFAYTACMQILATATGAQGMIAGQADEIRLQDKKSLKIDDIIGMYSYKTGALLSASLSIGYELSLAEEGAIAILDNIGRVLGTLYQIKDDLDDISLTTDELGKPAHSDEKNGKHTYISLRGLDGTKEDMRIMTQLINDDLVMLEKKGAETIVLKDFVYFVLHKDK